MWGIDGEVVSNVMWGNQMKLLWQATALISPNDSFKNSLLQPLSTTPTGSPVVWTCHLKLTWSVGFMLFALFHLNGARLIRPRITLGSKAARWSDTETMKWRAAGMFSSHVSFHFVHLKLMEPELVYFSYYQTNSIYNLNGTEQKCMRW